jgi:hypothetical protein
MLCGTAAPGCARGFPSLTVWILSGICRRVNLTSHLPAREYPFGHNDGSVVPKGLEL